MELTDSFINEFLELCRNGKTPTQIAVRLNMLRDELTVLSKTEHFKAIWQKGKELYQAYHEDLLDQMMSEGSRADTKDRDLQRWRLETHFKNDWSDKPEEKEDTDRITTLTNAELEEKIKQLANLPHIRQIIDEQV
jgi:hypothetical protein